MRAFLIISLLLAAAPVHAKWDYCYFGDAPEGVNLYVEMPPRPFGFEIALLPVNFKRLCGLDGRAEAAHIRRLVADYLECAPDSDLARKIDTVLDAHVTTLALSYFNHPKPPKGPVWRQVCISAQAASVEHLAFADTWYFDSPTPKEDRARLDELLTALNAFSASQTEARQ